MSAGYERLAGHVRGCLGQWCSINAGLLGRMLEVPPSRARALYAGSASYTLRELAILSDVFEVPLTAWFEEDWPRVRPLPWSARKRDMYAVALDRALTARELAR